MFLGWKKRCRQLEAENAQLKAHTAQWEARLTESQAKNQQLIPALAAATKNSHHSSKPPSSDIVKPPSKPPGKGKRRKIGGQPGHPKHEHAAFTPAQIAHHLSYELEHCPVDPSHRLVPLADEQKIIQQVELADQPFWGLTFGAPIANTPANVACSSSSAWRI
jgi:transposase